MFKKYTKSVICASLLVSSVSASAANNWSAEIKNVYAYSGGQAKVFLTNLRNGPAGQANTGCTSEGVWLSLLSGQTATPELLSVALTMFASKTPVRIAIKGEGSDCTVINMGSET